MGISASGTAGGCGIFGRPSVNHAVLIPIAGLLLSGLGGIILNAFQATLLKLAGVISLYLGGSILLLNVCSFQMSISLLVVGISVTVLLGTGHRGHNWLRSEMKGGIRQTLVFRLLLSLILGVLAFTVTERLRLWIPVRRTVLFAAVWISLMCLLSLSVDDDLLYRCIYLQGICLSFTLIYIYMGSSVLVFACFAAINLLMAFGSAVLTTGKDNSPVNDAENTI